MVPGTVGFVPDRAPVVRLGMAGVDNGSLIDSVSVPGYARVNYATLLRSRPVCIAELKLTARPRIDQFKARGGFAVARD